MDNGVAAGLFEVFKNPEACFLYVSRVPHNIIALLDAMGGPNGPANAVNQRLETFDVSGNALSRFYFEGVKMLDSVTSDLLDVRDAGGTHLFTETEVSDHYNNLRVPDGSIDDDLPGFYQMTSDTKRVLATPTQVYASEDLYDQISRDDDLKRIFERTMTEAQQRRGNFPEDR